jgi:hypothetical protein
MVFIAGSTRLQRFGHRPHTDQHLGIRTPDRSLCAYRLHRAKVAIGVPRCCQCLHPLRRLFTQTCLAGRKF